MATQTKFVGIIVKEYCAKYPNTSSTTLANMIIAEVPNFKEKDKENLRNSIRYYRGTHGNKRRGWKIFDNYIPKTHSQDFTPFFISQSKTLIISDLHLPYHNVEAIGLALDYGLKKNVNCVLINGDLIDFADISRHEKDWRNRPTTEEIEYTRLFIEGLRETFPTQRIVFKYGNHDERWDKYIHENADRIADFAELELEYVLRCRELDIEVVKDKRPIKIGKLTVLHGHELAGGSGGVNPARATFLKTLDSVIVGHYNKTSQHTETTMNGDVISVESQGCLCGMNPLYMPINKWNLGFSYVEMDVKTGEYHLHNKKIIKGKIY